MFSFLVGAFSFFIRVGVVREQSVRPYNSYKSIYKYDCCHNQQG